MQFLKSHVWWAVIIVIGVIISWWFLNNKNGTPLITTVAEIGTVTSYISVSGIATVDDIIPLSFPKGGTVSGVFVSRGDEVATGTILATVGDTSLQADYAATLAEVTRVRAVRDELLSGQTVEEAVVTNTTIKNAEDALTNTIRTEAARVEAARTALYSTGLTAFANNPDTESPPPTVSGSYTCTAEGTYTIELYRSGTLSGYSYRYSGIETGVNNASTNQSSALGECGLRLQFTPDASYNNAVFTINIPNTASPTYSTNRALLDQAITQEEANIAAARRALDLALNQGSVATAGTRVEKIIAANASVATAEARLTQASFALSESALRAPSSGIIANIDIVVGQTVATNPIITLFVPKKTTVIARIPEKDIARLMTNQTASLVFDANPTEILQGMVTFLSPIQTIINGIPYYDAIITLDTTPFWLRSGMQADVDITIETVENIVRIPRLYITDNTVLLKNGDRIETAKVEILLYGTDGFVAISGIKEGDEIILRTD